MEAPVCRILVFAPAVGAHHKPGHRRQRAVVGDPGGDRESRPAVRTVDERIPVAAIGGIQELAETRSTGRYVSGDGGVRPAAARAPPDLEPALAGRAQRLPGNALDHREWRGVRREPSCELVDRGRGSLHLDGHAGGVVADVPVEPELACEAIDERAETDPLDGAEHARAHAARRDRRRDHVVSSSIRARRR